MAKKKTTKKSGLPEPLVKGVYSESALVKQETKYDAPGVRYGGYAQLLLPNGDRRLLKQERSSVYLYANTYPGAPNPQVRTATIPTGYDFYVTLIQIQTNSLSSAGSIIIYNGPIASNRVVHTHQISQNEYMTYIKPFELPLKFSGSVEMNMYFTGVAGDSYYVELQGFLEERA